jgi:hypothetical protein
MTLFWSFGQHCGGSLPSHHTIGEEQWKETKNI